MVCLRPVICRRSLRSESSQVIGCYYCRFTGWLLDAFDFFLVTFCLTSMAKEFRKTDAEIALVITMTLAFRTGQF